MNLRDLQYIVALADERHFGRAAERCFVSQPTLSGQVKKLEEELGVPLVERSGRRVILTDAGKSVVERARRVLTEARGVHEAAAAFKDPLAGRLHLGVIPTIAPYLLPRAIPRLHREYPDLAVFLHEHQTAVLLDMLRRGILDLLLLALPVETDEFDETHLFDEPFWLTVPADDPLRARKRASLGDLEGRKVLLLEEGHCLRGQALDVCLSAGADEFEGFRATSLETLRQMVAEGIGITLMPELAVSPVPREDIRYIPFEAPPPSRRIGLMFRRGSPRTEAFEAVGRVIIEASRGAPARGATPDI